MAEPTRDEIPREAPEVVRNARAVAHRAVTEGVNLAYVDRMRRELYYLADAYEALDQRAQREEAPPAFRYELVAESDEYELLQSLHEVASAALAERDGEVRWTVRSDEDLRG